MHKHYKHSCDDIHNTHSECLKEGSLYSLKCLKFKCDASCCRVRLGGCVVKA